MPLVIPNLQQPHQLLVLAGGMEPSGELSPLSAERVHYAVEHAATHDVPRIVLSGGQSWIDKQMAGHPVTEAEAMAEMAVDLGVSEASLVLETWSTNTLTNLARSAILLDPEMETGIVTHAFHMPRARFAASHTLEMPYFTLPVWKRHRGSIRHEIPALALAAATLARLPHSEPQAVINRTERMQAAVHRLNLLDAFHLIKRH